LRRRPSLQPRFPIDCRLSSATNLRQLPTCVVCQPSGVAFQLNLRLNIGIRSNGQPSGLSSACASDQSSVLPSDQSTACAFDQPSGSPSDSSPTCAGDRPSGPTFRSTCGLRRRLTFRLRLSTDLRPSPPADPPAMPSDESPACAFDSSSGSTFQSTSSFRLQSTFRPCLQT
jgi:hypothetical protein